MKSRQKRDLLDKSTKLIADSKFYTRKIHEQNFKLHVRR